jgi:protein arginine N-methyltransferase 5
MLETPYVVKFRDVFHISKPQQMWKFIHPNLELMQPFGHPDFNSHNTRYSSTTFPIDEDVVLHGFAAYFECRLFGDVTLSIHPESHSKDMTSWFPMFFPIKVTKHY